jgi:hypothetical protein
MTPEEITKVLGDSWKKSSSFTKQDMIEIKKNDRKLSSCQGKTGHKTEEDALIECRKSSSYLEVYKCSFCGLYHVGKNREIHKVTRKRPK